MNIICNGWLTQLRQEHLTSKYGIRNNDVYVLQSGGNWR